MFQAEVCGDSDDVSESKIRGEVILKRSSLNTTKLLEGLRERLSPVYTLPNGMGGHDINHIRRMLAMYHEMTSFIPGVSREEYEIAVWLHNVDRYEHFEIKTRGLETVLREFLAPGNLVRETKNRIINAVEEHSKRDDGPNDSPLLQALRLADKWDRIGVLGIGDGFSFRGSVVPAYHYGNPFSYGCTTEAQWQTQYTNFFRVLEWYPAFPLIRELVKRHPWRFEHFLFFIRAFAREVAKAHAVKNTVENDIRKCLGTYYDEWAPK